MIVARGNQRVVPGYGFQKASAIVRGAPPPSNGEVGGNTTRSTNVQRPATFLEAARRAQAAASGGGHKQQDVVLELASQLVHEDAREVEDEAIELAPTLPEEMSYDEVRRALHKLERALQRKTRRHKNETDRVAEKQELIDSHQAELVLLQSIADATMAEMQDCKATIAELSERQAALAADRARAEAPGVTPTAENDGVRYAFKCVEDIVAGIRNFEHELPQVQTLLTQLAAAIDAARGGHGPQPPALQVLVQQSIRAAFERQANAAQQFHIASGSVTPEQEASRPQRLDSCTSGHADMEVVGQRPWDKRKIDQIASSFSVSDAGDITGDELASDEKNEGPSTVSDVQAQPICGTAEHEKQPTASFTCSSSHEALRKQLMEQNERSRKARMVCTERSMPY